MVKKLRVAYNLCCSSEQHNQSERDHIHFYFAINAIIHKLTKGECTRYGANERTSKAK